MNIVCVILSSVMRRRDIFEKSNNSFNNNAVIQNLRNKLIELDNQSRYSKDLNMYILFALENDMFIQPTIDFLKKSVK